MRRSRSRSIYDAQGKLAEFVNNELVWSRPDYVIRAANNLPTILPDLPEFVSPIDGKLYRGRAGLREHCKKHDVVPTADLKGLPPRTMVTHEFSPQYREDTRRTIAEIFNSR